MVVMARSLWGVLYMLIAPFHQVKLNFLMQLNMAKGERSCIKLSATVKETSSLFSLIHINFKEQTYWACVQRKRRG